MEIPIELLLKTTSQLINKYAQLRELASSQKRSLGEFINDVMSGEHARSTEVYKAQAIRILEEIIILKKGIDMPHDGEDRDIVKLNKLTPVTQDTIKTSVSNFSVAHSLPFPSKN